MLDAFYSLNDQDAPMFFHLVLLKSYFPAFSRRLPYKNYGKVIKEIQIVVIFNCGPFFVKMIKKLS